MQNKYYSADEAGYVALNGGWCCDSCGCQNGGWDYCSNCGWNRCGCGGVVRTETRQSRERCGCNDGEEAQERSRTRTCGECPEDRSAEKQVQCCPDNTRIRSSCACNGTAVTSRQRNCGCEKDCDNCNDTAVASRQRNCGCEKDCDNCNGTAVASRSRNCGCEKDCDNCNGTAVTSRRNSHVGMVYAVEQEMEQVYESESALRTGTLFPSLHKPMNGYCAGHGNCADDKQEAAFAAWDLRLYLNTHPDDVKAKELFRCLCKEVDDPNYATTFLDDACCGSDWNWTDDPWPWECRPCGK